MRINILALYENRINKASLENYTEIDSNDLESFKTSPQYDLFEFPTMMFGGKTILEWFKLDNVSYWWLVYSLLGSRLNESTLFIDKLTSCLKYYSPHILIVKGNYDKIPLISQICKQNNVILKISKFNFIIFKIKQAFHNSFKRYAYKRITLQKHRRRLKRFYEKKGYKYSFEPESAIITAPGVYSRMMIDVITGKSERQEFILQPIIDLIKQNKNQLLCFDLDYTFRGNEKPLVDRLEDNLNWIPIETLISRPKSMSLKKSISSLQKSINKLINSDISELLNYKNVKLWEYFKPVLNEIFYEPYLPNYLHLMEQLEELFSKNRPTIIIQVYETGPYAKAFEMVAKKLGIRTIGIQHGVIYDGNPDYMHKQIFERSNPLGNPIPDLTLVFGEHYKKILTQKGRYPNDRVVVIGNPSFYEIEKIKLHLDKESIKTKYTIPNKKIILVPLTFRASILTNNPDLLLLEILYNHFKNFKEIVVLVRLHPTDVENTKEILYSKFPTSNFVYSRGSLIEDIFISDLIVTSYSTVGIDAAILDKPVIFIGLGNVVTDEFQRDMMNHGIAMMCNKDDLIQKISLILNNELHLEGGLKRTEFLESYFNFGKSVDLMKIIYG